MGQRNRVLELFFYAALSIIFIILFFVNKPYNKKPVHIDSPAKTSVESRVSTNDAIFVQP